MSEPFNLALHEHLVALGYNHTRHPEELYDPDDPECVDGNRACDEYEGSDDYVLVYENGEAHYAKKRMMRSAEELQRELDAK